MSDIGPTLDALAPYLAPMVAEATKGAVQGSLSSMYLPGTVLSVDIINRVAVVSPDDLVAGTQISAQLLSAAPPVGARVMLLLQPPSSVFVLGAISEPSSTLDIANARSVYLKPAAALYETFTRAGVVPVDTAVLASQRLQMVAIALAAGVPINSITFMAGSTSLNTGVNQWFALFDSNRNLMGVTADDTNVAWAANTTKTLTLASQVVPTASGLYYLGIMVRATIVPTLLAAAPGTIVNSLPPILHGSADTGLTNPASCPAAAAALTARTGIPYAYVS